MNEYTIAQRCNSDLPQVFNDGTGVVVLSDGGSAT